MRYLVEAYDKHGLQVLGNGYGQGFIRAKNYKKTLLYKNLKQLAQDRIEQYKILACNEINVYNTVLQLLETVYIQDLT